MGSAENFYLGSKYERKPAGVVTIDGIESMHFKQCVHCQAQWRSIETLDDAEIRAGRHQLQLRGFCRKCMGPTCGPLCDKECVNWEKKMEMIEKGIPIYNGW